MTFILIGITQITISPFRIVPIVLDVGICIQGIPPAGPTRETGASGLPVVYLIGFFFFEFSFLNVSQIFFPHVHFIIFFLLVNFEQRDTCIRVYDDDDQWSWYRGWVGGGGGVGRGVFAFVEGSTVKGATTS